MKKNSSIDVTRIKRCFDYPDNTFTAVPLFIFAFTALFSMLCFIFNIKPVTVSLLLAVIATGAMGCIFGRKVLAALAITVILAFISIKFSGGIYDVSFDGMAFHKEAVYSIARGWNPLRTSFWYFDYFGKVQDTALWLDNYPKGVWSLYACVYNIFGKIEYAKGINILFVLMVFFAAYDTVYSVFNKNGVLRFLFAVVFAVNPVVMSQYFTFMNDLPVAALTMLCAFLGMKIYAQKADRLDYICLAAAFSSSFAVKFTAPVFCGAVLMGFGAAVAIKSRKNVLKPCVVVIAAAVIGVTLMGADPYIKHIVNGQNPIYPVMGEGSYDIMNTNAPAGLDDMSNPKALLVSLFSKLSSGPGEKPEIKIPFSIDPDSEIWNAGTADPRLSGFGVWFSGILLVSMVLGIFALLKSKNASPVIPPLIVFVLLALFFPESWWARYNPYIYYIPCLITLAFSCAGKTAAAAAAMCILIIANSGISGLCTLRNFYVQTRVIEWKILEINQTHRHIMFCIPDFPCHEIWLNENDVDFELVPNFKDKEGTEFYRTTEFIVDGDDDFEFNEIK